ncbi:MucBP domain-containing protein, partial [Streptococcus mitis]
ETPVFTPGTTKVNGKTITVPIDETVAPTFDDGTTEKKVPGEGTYTIDKNGKVTFTPEPDFVGTAKGVTVKRVDENGTPVTATYTPTVLGKTTTENVVSEGAKGQPQSNTPVFKGDVDTTVAPTFKDGSTEKKVPGEGTYTIDKDGKVTFTPEPNFVGKATPVKVVRKDKNGKTIKASYTPTVRPDTVFVDKNGKELVPSKDGKNPSETIPGYKLVKTETDEKGNTKHIYEPVTTKHVDKNGNPIPGTTTEEGTKDPKKIPGYKVVETRKLPNGDTEYVYEKVTTSFVDTEGHVIEGTTTEEGTTPKKDIPGYKFVETRTTEDGNTEHVYEKVTTSFKDKEGNVIPNFPTEDGDQPKKDIPGYRFVETKKLPNGDTEHVYEKVKTSFKDKDGNEIPNYPTEDGDQPKKDIPGYRFVETKKLPNGDIEHVYEKVTQPAPTPSPVPQPNPGKQNTTIWTDENGNPLKPTEPGSKEPGTIPGYEYVKTVTDPAGTIKHIFRKVEMPTPVDPSQPVQPVEPATPAMPEQPAKPQVPATPAQPAQPTAVKEAEGKRELPNTGTEDHANLAALGLLGVLSGFGLVARKKKED